MDNYGISVLNISGGRGSLYGEIQVEQVWICLGAEVVALYMGAGTPMWIEWQRTTENIAIPQLCWQSVINQAEN